MTSYQQSALEAATDAEFVSRALGYGFQVAGPSARGSILVQEPTGHAWIFTRLGSVKLGNVPIRMMLPSKWTKDNVARMENPRNGEAITFETPEEWVAAAKRLIARGMTPGFDMDAEGRYVLLVEDDLDSLSESNPAPANASVHYKAGYKWLKAKQKSSKGSFNRDTGMVAYLSKLGYVDPDSRFAYEGTSEVVTRRRGEAKHIKEEWQRGADDAWEENFIKDEGDNLTLGDFSENPARSRAQYGLARAVLAKGKAIGTMGVEAAKEIVDGTVGAIGDLPDRAVRAIDRIDRANPRAKARAKLVKVKI